MRSREIEADTSRAGRQELLEREVLEIVDGERQRLGLELHDGLCQSLAGIAALSSALSRNLAAGGQSGPAAAANEIFRLLIEAIGDARDLARLSAISLNHAGLVSTLETVARNVSHTYNISCTFASDRRGLRLPHETQIQLVRIAQEAARNALTHGRADQIAICVECLGGSGLLSIRDNGVGLSEGDRNPDGIGLQTMRYRARAIGGSLTIARRPEGGASVACAFPLPQARDSCEGYPDASH
jgi:signal transduction histidine kinase